MRPEDQLVLRDCMRRQSLLDSFLEYIDTDPQANPAWLGKNGRLFLEVCDLHGQTAIQHHEQLVNKFIELPADDDDLQDRDGLTASGPPLPVLIKGLKKLCDLRAAVDNPDIPSRFQDIARLRERVEAVTHTN